MKIEDRPLKHPGGLKSYPIPLNNCKPGTIIPKKLLMIRVLSVREKPFEQSRTVSVQAVYYTKIYSIVTALKNITITNLLMTIKIGRKKLDLPSYIGIAKKSSLVCLCVSECNRSSFEMV